jgi:hypothetical protein
MLGIERKERKGKLKAKVNSAGDPFPFRHPDLISTVEPRLPRTEYLDITPIE